MFDAFSRGRKKGSKTATPDVPSSERDTARDRLNQAEFWLSTRSFRDFRTNDVAIKLWLPELAERRLVELSDHWGLSRSRLLRFVFFRHLYGEYEFEAMRAKSEGLFYPFGSIMASVAKHHRSGPNTTPELGKNAEDVKLWLPSRMRADLQRLADQAGRPLSQFMREILVTTLFGHLPLSEALQREPDQPEE